MSYEYIAENLRIVEKRILSACEKSGRNREEIKLIAVTKTFDVEIINASLEFGIEAIAENKVQEIERKFPEISKPAKKHMIGHLQRNKVKNIVGNIDLIQSVDSIRLIDEIQKQSEKKGLITEVLIQVNIGEEEQKFGISENDLPDLLKHASKQKNIRVRGFMAMAPFLDNPEETRPYFKKMKKIFETQRNLSYNGIELDTLSMGMSGDFEVAIEEGANMVRIGSAIYGKRNYK